MKKYAGKTCETQIKLSLSRDYPWNSFDEKSKIPNAKLRSNILQAPLPQINLTLKINFFLYF